MILPTGQGNVENYMHDLSRIDLQWNDETRVSGAEDNILSYCNFSPVFFRIHYIFI